MHSACWKTCMWANTMSTSDLGAADLRAPAAALDAAAIARLANEFFAALPQNPAHPAGLPRPLPAATDSVAPPATAAGAAAFAPANPGAVPVHGAPGSPAYIYNAAEAALNVAPSFSEPSGLFSFPSVPGVQAVPGTPAVAAPPPEPVPLPASAPAAPDSMPDPLALTQLANQFFSALPGNGAPPASLPQLPPVSELFSFPGVPGLPSVPGLPPPPGITPVPDTANAPALPAAPNVPPYSPEPERFSPFDAALSFPVTSDLFILPGVPGAQSLPGTPVL